jgi:four helix bundle protein
MKAARSFRDLVVWQKAHQLVLDLYRFSRGFPDDERFGLTSQFRRAAVSVPANIAEGFPKRGTSDKMRFFNIAQGSLEEVHYYLLLATDLGYGDGGKFLEQRDQVAKLLNAYISAINSSIS